MSCCCATPSAAALGAAIYVLTLSVPTLFYVGVELIFDYNTLDAPGLFLLIAVNNFVATVAALLALIGRKWKAQAKATILLQSAAGAGALSLMLSIASTVWVIVESLATSIDLTAQRRTLIVGGCILVSGGFLLIPQAWACTAWWGLSKPAPSKGRNQRVAGQDDESELEHTLKRAPRSSLMYASSASGSDSDDVGGGRKDSMSDSEGEAELARRQSTSSSTKRPLVGSGDAGTGAGRRQSSSTKQTSAGSAQEMELGRRMSQSARRR